MKKAKVDKAVFAEVYAATKSPGKAMIAAQPDLITKKNYANVKAHRMLAKSDVQTKIQQNLEKMSKKAIKRIDELIQSEDEAIATTNSWKTIEHIRGKPIAKNLNMNANVSIEDALLD
jgi:hypothetical protein